MSDNKSYLSAHIFLNCFSRKLTLTGKTSNFTENFA